MLRPRLFLDASVLVTAANSPNGGSAKILDLALEGKIKIVVSRKILQETKESVCEHFGKTVWMRFYRKLSPLRVSIVASPTKEEKLSWKNVTVAKDTHVLAGALKAGADYLVTLDKRHILKASVQETFPVPIMSPGDFIKSQGPF